MRFLPIACLLLAGCAAPVIHWTKPGIPRGPVSEPLRIDSAQCDVQAATSAAPIQNGWTAVAVQDRVYRSCMIGKGWTEVEK